MARGIYEIKLKERYFPALSATEALEMQNNGNYCGGEKDEEVEINLMVTEEHTMQLFLLAKTMSDMEKFNYQEIEAVIVALAREMGYSSIATEVADCVLTWVERVAEDMTIHDLEEWIIG